MKILVTPRSYGKSINLEAQTLLNAFADEVIAVKPETPFSEDELIRLLDGCDGYIAGLDSITKRVIDASPCLKVISRWGVGYENVDLIAAKAKGITLTNTPGTNSRSVAELSLGLMICCARNICEQDDAVHHAQWPNQTGIELLHKKLGIVGLGAVGRHLAVMASSIGMDVCAYDPFFNEAFAAKHQIQQVDLQTLIQTCDFISLHVPVTPQTQNMIGAKEIIAMKDGAILINAARGGLVDEAALAEALKTGKLAGAGLDAFCEEPPVHSPLLDAPHLVMLPHTGSHTIDAIQSMGRMAVQNLIDELSGRNCGHRVQF